jgi:HKD family nuclease
MAGSCNGLETVLIDQTETRPGEAIRIIESVASPSVIRIRLAVAYITTAGVALLLSRVRNRLGPAWDEAEKAIMTCFDYGATEPNALRFLRRSGFSILIAQPDVLDTPGLRPTVAFHPKLYIFDSRRVVRLLVGSPNISDRALTANTEAGALLEARTAASRAEVNEAWNRISVGAVPLTPALLRRYENARKTLRIPRPARRKGAPPASQPSQRAENPEEPLTEAVIPGRAGAAPSLAASLGRLDPSLYDHFWVQAGMMSGGSRNQLELPRHGSQFFGFSFAAYGSAPAQIGLLSLTSGGRTWSGRPLRWHANNGMERLNLPTVAQGGFDYRDTAVMFRRHGADFEVFVEPWGSPLAVSWRNASDKLGLVFTLGAASPRLCGLF